eukprot:6214093-Pleurochrysis_carterae.AAC.7
MGLWRRSRKLHQVKLFSYQIGSTVYKHGRGLDVIVELLQTALCGLKWRRHCRPHIANKRKPFKILHCMQSSS